MAVIRFKSRFNLDAEQLQSNNECHCINFIDRDGKLDLENEAENGAYCTLKFCEL